jgi:predicted enzyme related to lactoylglutathione lyase
LQKLMNIIKIVFSYLEVKELAKVIHFEIPATDTKRAVDFYKNVFGWQFVSYGGGEMDYWLITAGKDEEPGINGAIAKKDEMHPETINTIAVSSFEESVDKIKAASGTVLTPKMTVPKVGYMAYCKDTEGNVFGIMQQDPKA